jgi:hypothetical protein
MTEDRPTQLARKSWKSVEGLTRIALKLDIAAQALTEAATNVADLESFILRRYQDSDDAWTIHYTPYNEFRRNYIKNLLDES